MKSKQQKYEEAVARSMKRLENSGLMRYEMQQKGLFMAKHHMGIRRGDTGHDAMITYLINNA